MAFISNQWLKSSPDRIRDHEPVETVLRWEDVDERWSKENKVKTSFRLAKAEGGVYQAVFFTAADLEFLLPELVRVASAKTKQRLLLDLLSAVSDKGLFSSLAAFFSDRALRAKAEGGSQETPSK